MLGDCWKNRPSLAVMVVAMAAAPGAMAAESRVPLDLPSQPLAAALESLATATRTQMLYSAELVHGLTAPAVKGELTASEALRTVLAGSGLEARITGEDKFTLISTNAAATRLGTVVVTGQREDQNYKANSATVGGKSPVPLREIANSVSVITRERMEDQNLTDVDHAMAWVTGVETRPNDGAQSQYYARGFALPIMNDGMPSYDSASGYQQFDLAMYDRIEVLRGPAGLMQGSSEPSGSINLVRKRPTDTPQASMTASAGSWNNYRTTADVSTPLTDDKTLKGRFAAAFTDRDFYYDDAHSQKWFGYGILEYTPNPDWTFDYSVAYQSDDNQPLGGLPTYSDGQPIDFSRSANTNTPWTWSEWVTHEEKLEAERRFSNGWTAKVGGSWREQTFAWKDGYAAGVNRATNTANYTLRDRDYVYYRKAADASVEGPFKLFGREHSLLLGTNIDIFNSQGDWGNNRTVNGVNIFNTGGVPEPNLVHTEGTETRTTQYGQYGQLRFRAFDPLLLIVGGRNTSFDSKNRAMTASQWGIWKQGAKAMNEFVPYAGAVLDITKETSVYGSYSEIFVPQTAMTVSGSVLPPRKGWQTEVGVKNDFLDGKLSATLAAFVVRDTNRAITDPANTNYSIAAGEVESKGWETEVTGAPVDGLKLTAGYTYLTTQYANSGSNTGTTFQTWMPRHSFKTWGVYSFGEGSGLDGFSLGAGIIAKSQTYSTSTQLHQNAYAVVDAQIGYQLNENLAVTLTGTNLFDNEYWAKMLTSTNNLYGEPRAFVLAIKASM